MQKKAFCRSLPCLAIICATANAQELAKNDKNVVALLDFGGATASALYGVVNADLNRRVPGDKYEDLARDITFRIESARASSTLVRAPFELVGDTLYASSMVDPEPLSRTATLIGGYAAKKFGETIGQTVVNAANAQADAVLKRALDEGKIDIGAFQTMPQEEFTAKLEGLMIGDKKLSELLKDYPQAIERIRGHAQDLRDTAQLATLKTVQAIRGDVSEVGSRVVEVTKKVEQLGKDVNESLDRVTGNLKELQSAVQQQGADMKSLQDSVEGNSAAIHSLAQVSSMTWTTDQKLAALDAGLFPDLGVAQQDAMRHALQSQQKTEKLIAGLQSTASTLGDVAAIASNLGVDQNVVKAAQVGQLAATAIASYCSGNYLGAAVATSSIFGVGKGATDGNAAMMSFMKAEFAKIHESLNQIISLQKQTLQAVAALSEQLQRMQLELNVIERAVSTTVIASQYLMLERWDSCKAASNRLYNSPVPTLEDFETIANDKEVQRYLNLCYDQFASFFDAHVSAGKWGYDVLDINVFPKSDAFQRKEDVEYYDALIKKTQAAYDATRDYFLTSQANDASKSPASYLAALLDPRQTVVSAHARDKRREGAKDQLGAFKCRESGTVQRGIETPLCQGVSEGAPPQSAIWPILLDGRLAGPMAPHLIDVGSSIASWATFSYVNGLKGTAYVPSADIAKVKIDGLSVAMKRALKDGRRKKLLLRLEQLADGYLLQQSLLYGDFTAQLVVDELYDLKAGALVAPPADADQRSNKALAFAAMKANETLARNAVVIALRRSMTNEKGVVQIRTYGWGFLDQDTFKACDQSAGGTQYLRSLLPGWTFTRAVTAEKKAADASYAACMTAEPTTQISTGFGVKIGDLFVPAPLPQTLFLGDLEQPASLRLALEEYRAVARELVDLDLSSSLKKDLSPDGMTFVKQLLSSQCLHGIECVEPSRQNHLD